MTAPPDLAAPATGAAGQTSRLLSPRQELRAYEGVRRGDEAAFRVIATAAQPLLRRLAALSTHDDDVARSMIDDTWHGVLRSLAMFTWHTSLTAWIAAGVVRRGRAHARQLALPTADVAAAAASAGVPGSPGSGAVGPSDWADLPFGARWAPALDVLDAARAGLPLQTREVVHLHDVERWPPATACDVLGLTAAHYEQTVVAAHQLLHDTLAAWLGEPRGDEPLLAMRVPRIAAALRLLHGPLLDESPLDPRTVRTFRIWAAEQAPLGRRVLARTRLVLRR